MKLTLLKRLAMNAGVYRRARSLHRQFVRPDRLRRFTQDKMFFESLLAPNSLCFDIGANVGEKSEALLAVGMRVVAFEPQPEPMRETQHRCSGYRNADFRQVAVGAESGNMPMFISSRGSATSSLRENWEGPSVGQISVPVITLDDAISEFGVPDYCKIDVEGWELHVFEGLSRPVPLVSFEYHITEADAAIGCLQCLTKLGNVSINITQGETFGFIGEKWLSIDEFVEVFPSSLTQAYGDIFVRISPDAN